MIEGTTSPGTDYDQLARELTDWKRSPYHHEVVFVTAGNGVDAACSNCAFKISGGYEHGCQFHPCRGGIWVTEQEAVVLRLES